MIKMIAVDMDGTFLTSEKTYNRERFAEIYQEIKKRNIKFVVASGNQYYQLRSFFPDKHREMAFVAENGAYVVNQQNPLFVGEMAPSTIQHTFDLLNNMDGVETIVCGERSAYVKTSESQAFFDDSKTFYHRLEWVDDFQEIDDQIIKFALVFPAENVKQSLTELAEKLGNQLVPVSSGHGAIDLIIPGIHKAHGLQLLQNIWNIDESELVAFGDSGNDLEMLKHAHYSYAMKNAAPEVLAVANYSTKLSNEEEGVLATIEELLLME